MSVCLSVCLTLSVTDLKEGGRLALQRETETGTELKLNDDLRSFICNFFEIQPSSREKLKKMCR